MGIQILLSSFENSPYYYLKAILERSIYSIRFN